LDLCFDMFFGFGLVCYCMVDDSDQLDCVIDLKQRSEEYGMFELGVQHLISDDESSDEEKILVGVDTLKDECVEILEEWESEWEDELVVVESEYLDVSPHVLVYEFKPV